MSEAIGSVQVRCRFPRTRSCRGRLAVCVPRHAAVVDNLKSQGRSRLASMPVHPQFNVTELAAAGKQADLETEWLRLKGTRSQVELARKKTPPPHRRHSSSEQ